MKQLTNWTILAVIVLMLALAAWPWVAGAQTTLPLDALRGIGNGRVVAIVGNSVVTVGLDGLTIDGGQLRLLDPPRPPAAWERLTYRPTGRVAEYVIPQAAAMVLVYRNGLLLTEPDDYALDGAVVRFAAGQIPDAGDIVNIVYERAP